MVKIALVDDEGYYLEKEKKITELFFSSKGIDCEIQTFQNSEWFIMGLEEERYDLYVLDVEMPGKNGLEAAKSIRRHYPDPVIIFVTNFVEYAVDAYEVNTYRYIPKELLEKKLPETYETLLSQLLEREENYYIIEVKNSLEKISSRKIQYLKKEGKYTVLVHQGQESRVRKALTAVVEELNAREFIMIDKSYAVNIRHVMSLKDQRIRMRDGTLLPVGAPRLQEVKRKITDFWRG